jgi:hypothetical protein
MKNIWIIAFVTTISSIIAPCMWSTTFTSATDGYWHHNSTWIGGTNVPQAGDAIVINHSVRITLAIYSAYEFKSLTINAGGTLTIDSVGYITIGPTGIGRRVDIHGSLVIAGDGILEVGGAAINCDGTIIVNADAGGIDAGASIFSINAGGVLNLLDGAVYGNSINISSGGIVNANGGDGMFALSNASIGGTITTSTSFPSTYVLTSSGSISVSGSIGVGAENLSQNYFWTSSLVLSPGSEVRYLRAGDQTIDASLAYYNLTLEGSGNKTIFSGITIQDRFKLDGTARFANYGRNVSCGSNLTNNSPSSHIFGNGTYTFTGTTIGGSAATVLDSATLNFTGSSITLGDGTLGHGNLTLKNVSFTNDNANLVIGATGYSGTVAFGGLLSMSGSNAAMTVSGGTVSMNNLTVSGANSLVSFAGGAARHGIAGNVICGNHMSVGTPVGVTGNVSISGDLAVNSEFDVNGTASVAQNLTISGSAAPAVNNFSGTVTVSGPVVAITGGVNAFDGGFTHSTTAVGSTCAIGGTYSDGSGGDATTINAESVGLTGSLTFNRLVITNAAGTLNAAADFTVLQTASLAKDLEMTGYTMTFAATAPKSSTIGSGEVIGTVHRTLESTGAYSFNGSAVTLLVPTLPTAEEYEFELVRTAPDQQAVTRYYDIRRVGSDLVPGAWLYTLGLDYRDVELNGNNENTLMLAHGVYDAAGEDQFTKLSSSSVNTTANIVTFVFDGITGFNHRYAIADLNSPLPVELVSFSARRFAEQVELRWKTATELNNYGFEIERAGTKDGPFTVVDFVAGQGTKNTPSSYSFDDLHAPAGTLYYRLRQIDRDGSVTNSSVVEVAAGEARFELSNHPNPFNPSTTIAFSAPADGRALLAVYDALGTRVATAFEADVREGEHVSVPFDAAELPGGVYFYTLTIGEVTKTGKMLLMK